MKKNAYDIIYKMLLTYIQMVKELLSNPVLKKYTQDFDLSTLEVFPTEFHSPEFRELRLDLVWRVRCKGKWAYIFIILEFQSSIDKKMPLRISAYTQALWKYLWDNDKKVRKNGLPAVLPIVIYNGKADWKNTAIKDIINYCPESLQPFQLNQQFFLLDVKKLPVELLKEGERLLDAFFNLESSSNREEIKNGLERLMKLLQKPEYS